MVRQDVPVQQVQPVRQVHPAQLAQQERPGLQGVLVRPAPQEPREAPEGAVR